jgi:membrane-associated protein
MARLPLSRLCIYALIAEATWVAIFLGAGYWFGSTRWVQEYLAVALVAIVALSLLPGAIAYLVRRIRARNG